jgi:DNA-binding transcriptional regulator WhiA
MYVEQKLTLREIAKTFNVSDACVAKIFKQQGVKIENGSNRVANRHVVVDYFEKDTEGAAYFYGLMLADGCMTGRGKRLTIDIQSDDSHILETMKNEINLPNPVAYQIRTSTLNKSCQLSFTVDGIYKSFINLGYTTRKSTKEFAPERFLNNRHFWRGLIDGDGSISKPENKNRRVYLCGSKELCDQFLSYCQSINPSIDTRTVLMKGELYRLSITGIKAATILNELYSNSTLFLNRKSENAEKLIEKYPEVKHVF